MPKPRYTRPGDPSNRASDRNDLVRELDRLDRKITEGQLWQHPQGGGGVDHPWKVSINGDGEAVIVDGRIYDSLMSGTELTFTNSLEEALIGDVVCLKYTYATEIVTVAVMTLASYEPTTVVSSVITESFHIIASLVANADDALVMDINQMSRDHLALLSICKDGDVIKTLRPI